MTVSNPRPHQPSRAVQRIRVSLPLVHSCVVDKTQRLKDLYFCAKTASCVVCCSKMEAAVQTMLITSRIVAQCCEQHLISFLLFLRYYSNLRRYLRAASSTRAALSANGAFFAARLRAMIVAFLTLYSLADCAIAKTTPHTVDLPLLVFSCSPALTAKRKEAVDLEVEHVANGYIKLQCTRRACRPQA